MTPEELVRCGVVDDSFFRNRTVFCTARNPLDRLATAARYHGMNVSSFLHACETSDPRVNHGLWSHCRPQNDFLRFCQLSFDINQIDTDLTQQLIAYGIEVPSYHRNAGHVVGDACAATKRAGDEVILRRSSPKLTGADADVAEAVKLSDERNSHALRECPHW